jgi:hypothetical protein
LGPETHEVLLPETSTIENTRDIPELFYKTIAEVLYRKKMADIVSEAHRINLHIFRNCIILTRGSMKITTMNRATSILYAHLNTVTLLLKALTYGNRKTPLLGNKNIPDAGNNIRIAISINIEECHYC